MWQNIGNLKGPKGEQGPSAYEIAISEGFSGTEAEWLLSLIGPQGDSGKDGLQGVGGTPGSDGEDGKSAYQIALDQGFVGSQAEWLASLKGAEGDPGDAGTPAAFVVFTVRSAFDAYAPATHETAVYVGP